jgi:hypothetical protein
MGAGAVQKTGALLVSGYLIPVPEAAEEENGNDGMSLLWSETSRLAGWLCLRRARHRRAADG